MNHFLPKHLLVALMGTLVPVVSLGADNLSPASDTENASGWILNTEVSDEFDSKELDPTKWFVQGQEGDYYIWKGRPPSQYAPHNVYPEDGVLKIRSQWEPDFAFFQGTYADGERNDTYGMWEGEPMPITTGGMISKKRFLNGYMEVRTRASNSNMISAFWALGFESELDIYEQIGVPKIEGNIKSNTWKASVHNWSPPAKRPTRRFGLHTELPFNTADEFHVYGAEWGEDYLKLFLDGELCYETTQQEQGKDWVLTNPLEVYFDSEVFVWLGLPHKEELPSYFEIDYVRVWQKPHKNLLARQFFGFEGPILFDENPIPLALLPESSEPNAYQKFWQFGEHEMGRFAIVKEQAAKGIKSLKFQPEGMLSDLSIVTPAKAVDLPAGDYVLSLKVLVSDDCDVAAFAIDLVDPSVSLDRFDLTGVKKGEWVTLTRTFTRDVASTASDRMRLRFSKDDVAEGTGALYIDDISIEAK